MMQIIWIYQEPSRGTATLYNHQTLSSLPSSPFPPSVCHIVSHFKLDCKLCQARTMSARVWHNGVLILFGGIGC